EEALVQQYVGPVREVAAVAWSPVASEPRFVAASWDGSILMFDPAVGIATQHVAQFPCLVYDVRWSPRFPNTFIAAAGDGTVRVYQGGLPGVTVPARPGADVLSCDWSPTSPYLLATADAEAGVRLWDLRFCQQPLAAMQGHSKAVNKVRFSPHLPSTLATASYDFTTRSVLRPNSILNKLPPSYCSLLHLLPPSYCSLLHL
ncbi:hypothetical protein HAZT_HAZT008706, partial [Hyalella azteca]